MDVFIVGLAEWQSVVLIGKLCLHTSHLHSLNGGGAPVGGVKAAHENRSTPVHSLFPR